MTVEVFVEIPNGSRNKYEWDHHSGGFRLDRMLFSSVHYPGDYGFIPNTWSGDNDPLDALVLLGEPTFPGCTITGRVVGVFDMTDDKGRDAKIITVADADPRWAQVGDLKDLPPHVLDEVQHFFSVYKDLERKRVTVEGFRDRAAALAQIEEDIQRFASLDRRPLMPGDAGITRA
ncbi:MAG: inorganic diphosphatase [Euzebya sp.]